MEISRDGKYRLEELKRNIWLAQMKMQVEQWIRQGHNEMKRDEKSRNNEINAFFCILRRRKKRSNEWKWEDFDTKWNVSFVWFWFG